MGTVGQHGGRLGCIILLATSCCCFQTKIPFATRRPNDFLRTGVVGRRLSRPRLGSSSSSSNLAPLNPPPSAAAASPGLPKILNDTDMEVLPLVLNVSSINSNNFSENGVESPPSIPTDLGTSSSTINNDFAATNLARTMMQQQPVYSLGVAKHYFEVLEDRSGKDYRWIKPLAKPVSQVMM